MREYEATLILPAEADESVITSALDRLTKAVEGSGGEVTQVNRWGSRRFAYEIDHQNEGFYLVVEFSVDPGTEVEVERSLRLADQVIRFKVVVRPEKKPAKKRAPAPSAATPPPVAAAPAAVAGEEAPQNQEETADTSTTPT